MTSTADAGGNKKYSTYINDINVIETVSGFLEHCFYSWHRSNTHDARVAPGDAVTNDPGEGSQIMLLDGGFTRQNHAASTITDTL